MSKFKLVLQNPLTLALLLSLSVVWISPGYRMAHGIGREFDQLQLFLTAPVWHVLLMANLWMLANGDRK